MSPPTLRIVLDLRQPQAYLALPPALELLREFGARACILPFEGKALLAPTEPGPDDDRGKVHRRSRAQMLAREVSVYAEAQGLHIEKPYRSGPSAAAGLAWLWVMETQPERLPDFLRRVFEQYWRAELDANNPADLRRVLDALHIDAAGIDAWSQRTGAARLEALGAELRTAGVFQAPAYLLGEELFIGRQHLPMIRWKLGGCTGKPPI